MDLFLKFDINFFSIILLLVLFITMRIRKEVISISSHLFFRMLWVTVFLLLLEVLSWTFDRVPGQHNLNYIFNMSFAWLTSLLTCMFASYIDYHIMGSYERLKKRFFYIHPFVITGILVFINIFEPIIFSISPDNVYQREPLMILLPIINATTFMYVCQLAYKKRASIQKEVIWVILIYFLMPAVVSFLQVALFGVFILWPMMAVTVVLTYIFLETVSTSKDYLTGILTRHRLDSYLEFMLERDKKFILAMIDLNKFKFINDTYGHINGDLALKFFSDSLSNRFKGEIVGRYGGDEFMIILKNMNCEKLKKSLNLVNSDMRELYIHKSIPFQIEFSVGFYERNEGENISYGKIVNIADQRMYDDKEKTYNQI